MGRRVELVKTDVSEESIASIFRAEEVTRAKESVPSNTFPRSRYFFLPEDGGDTFLETSVYNKPSRRYIQEGGILDMVCFWAVLNGLGGLKVVT
jgi:hypothetical protein